MDDDQKIVIIKRCLSVFADGRPDYLPAPGNRIALARQCNQEDRAVRTLLVLLLHREPTAFEVREALPS